MNDFVFGVFLDDRVVFRSTNFMRAVEMYDYYKEDHPYQDVQIKILEE